MTQESEQIVRIFDIEQVFGELVALHREENSFVRMYRHEALREFPQEDRKEICRMMVACLEERLTSFSARRSSFAHVPAWLRVQAEESLDGHIGMIKVHLRRWKYRLDIEEGWVKRKKDKIEKDELRARIDIIELIGQFTDLRLRGDRAMGKCVFHEDGIDSLSIDRKKGLWHCFAGCGGGDVFSFIMKKYGKNFVEALDIARDLISG